jgi:hypothetical protein
MGRLVDDGRQEACEKIAMVSRLSPGDQMK